MILIPWQNYLFPLCITTGYYVTLKSISYLHNKDNLRIVFEFPAIKWCRISFIKCDYVSIQKLVLQKPIYAWQTGDCFGRCLKLFPCLHKGIVLKYFFFNYNMNIIGEGRYFAWQQVTPNLQSNGEFLQFGVLDFAVERPITF